jgi:ADP-heptose:LPS heptosyltransferase
VSLFKRTDGNRFLVVQLRAIGDVVLTTALPRIIKEAHPSAFVGFLTERPSDELLHHNPHIDRIFLHERRGGIRGGFRLAHELRSCGFDTAVDTMCNPTTAIFTVLSGARVRAGFYSYQRTAAYNRRVRRGEGYAVEVKKTLLERIGLESGWDRPEIYLTDEERAWGAAVCGVALARTGRSRFFTVDAAHKHGYRRWTLEGFADLCRLLADRYDAAPMVLCAPSEREDAERLAALVPDLISVSPPTTLRELAALIAAADFHLGTCSAPRHIAVAVGTPTFIIPTTSQASWKHPSAEHGEDPYRPPCNGCPTPCSPFDTLRCMKERTAADIAPHAFAWGDALFSPSAEKEG